MTTPLPATGINLLGVFAHPDDEQLLSGVFTMAVDAGARAYILCATRGQAGQISDPSFATPETLGEVREGELKEALRRLGWEPPIFLDYYDGKLNQLPAGELASEVVRVIRQLKPRVVVTFEKTGGYGHVDHIAIHHATNDAVTLAADPAYRPDLGAPHQVDKFYYVVIPRSVVAAMLQEAGDEFDPGGDQRTITFEQMGVPDDEITTITDASAYRERSAYAFEAHRTQFDPKTQAAFREMAERTGFFGKSYLQRIIPAPAPGAALPDEPNLLAGLI